jgi:hypothetical protein
MYASSEDRHPRQRSEFKDRKHRNRGSSDDRHRRRDSGSDDRYHRGRSRSDDRHPRQRSEPEDRHRRKTHLSSIYINCYGLNLIDSETVGLLTYYFQPTETAREHPITHQLYPLQQEHRHLDRGSRWLQVVTDSRARVRIQADNMDQVRRDTMPMLDRSHTYNRARC